jgi:CBS domain containing-hemolysin-like protein
MRKLRRIPEEGDFVEDQGYRFIVESLKGRRAERVRIDKTETNTSFTADDSLSGKSINET